MEAIRELRETNSDKIVIDIPEGFRKKKVEIIVLPGQESASSRKRFSGFLENPIEIDNFRMPPRDERNAR